ncbi:MAG TPA: HD domain-containing phosphohydrolase [Opitutaceae bacterium]|nr:HD domain-containing phosphohydrolase [Opitutaceae bacterium]
MQPPRILFVDDDPNVLAAFQRTLRKQFSFDTAQGGTEALAMIKECGPYAVIVADMQMPGMNGIELLSVAREDSPDTVRVMLTGNADQQTAVEAVNQGAVFRFLTKPCPPEELHSTLQSSLKQYELQRVERDLLETTLAGSVKVLGEVLSMIDPPSFGRGQKLRDSVRVFGRFLNLRTTWEIEVAAMLSHLGHVSIPPTILRKLDTEMALFPREQVIVDRAPQVGHDLLINISRLEPVAEIILYQNKRYDGGGYPNDEVKGNAIPFGARVLRILHDRAVLEDDGIVKARALETMKQRSGVYDPDLLQKCFSCFQAFLENAISAERAVKHLTVGELCPGNVLVSDVRTTSGVLLVSAGNRVSDTMINRLKNYAEFDGVREPIFVQ